MNANELADYLENDFQIQEAVIDMLRQQQAEIEAFKQVIDANNLSQNIGQFVKPANEPVAWMHPDGKFNKKETWLFHIPLYTHPAKTLTDEEIDEVLYSMDWAHDPVDFARAILKKASEK